MYSKKHFNSHRFHVRIIVFVSWFMVHQFFIAVGLLGLGRCPSRVLTMTNHSSARHWNWFICRCTVLSLVVPRDYCCECSLSDSVRSSSRFSRLETFFAESVKESAFFKWKCLLTRGVTHAVHWEIYTWWHSTDAHWDGHTVLIRVQDTPRNS